jgi:uroporphyrinogen III methyltransferase/synthase
MAVFLIGAGPGDPMLLTRRAYELVKKADVIIHDRLIDQRVLQEVKQSCILVDVGKKPGGDHFQEEINNLLIKYGSKYDTVVRLKGGDPLVFARINEEVKALFEAKITYRIVPGITSALASSLACGVPLTYRGLTRAFKVLTTRSVSPLEQQVIDDLNSTLIFLMGAETKSDIVNYLYKIGATDSDEIAVVHWATAFWQDVVFAKLKDLHELKVLPPAAILFSKSADFKFLPCNGPFAGKKIFITRSFADANELEEILWRNGADCYCTSTTTIKILIPENIEFSNFIKENNIDFILFSSAKAVKIFFTHLKDVRELKNVKFCAFGQKTKDALLFYGINPEFFFTGSSSKGVAKQIVQLAQPAKVLYPRSVKSVGYIESEFADIGQKPLVIDLYDTVPKEFSQEERKALLSADVVVCYAPSQAIALSGFVDEIADKYFVAIGDTTKKALKDLGLRNIKRSQAPDTQSVYQAVLAVTKLIS